MLDAVGAIVETLVSLDLLADAAKPLDKMVIATLGHFNSDSKAMITVPSPSFLRLIQGNK